MGYTISARFKNIVERDQMLSFLDNHQNLIDKLQDSTYTAINLTPTLGEDLSYVPKQKKLLIGFDNTITRYCLWALCAWMGVQSEYKDKNKQSILYYDHEKYLIVPNKKGSDVEVDERGVSIKKRKDGGSGMDKIYGENYDMVKEIITNLDSQWQSFLCMKNEKLQKEKNKKIKIL